ncbi:MAG: ATP-binding protein, partial [Myxococcota bacterium]
QKNGRNLLAILNDILDLSKIEAREMRVERIPCSPMRVLEEVMALLRVRAEKKEVELEFQAEGPVPETILSDPNRLRQILLNLVGNAIKFTERGSVRVTVQLARGEHPQLEFDVADTGVGIPEEQLPALFEPFAQGDTSMSRRFAGTGLGLAISRRLARILGGDVVLRDTVPAEGSRFRVTINLADPGAEAADETGATREVARVTEESGPQAGRVLVAEDQADIRTALRSVLENAGYDVTVVENGLRALDAAAHALERECPFDVILMDVQMPVMDGYEATSALRTIGYEHPIIALTAHAMSGDRERCIASGCDAYATKPIERRALLELIEAHREKPKRLD